MTERETMAREYEAINNRLYLLQLLVLGILLAVYQLCGFSEALADGLTARFGPDQWYLTNAVYILISVFGFSAFMSPFSYYSGHVLEHHYELSNESTADWMADFFKSLVLDLILATILFSVIYALLRWIPDYWWLAGAGFYILFGVVLSILAPVVIMPLFHKFEPLQEGELTEAVREMMNNAGIRVVGVYKWGLEEKTNTANAAFTGIGRTKRIILGDTLLSGYSREEILSVLAHEVGHYKHRDILRLSIIQSVFAFLGFYVANIVLRAGVSFYGLNSVADIGAAPLFIFSIFVFSLITMPFANSYSRQREYAADAYAVEKMGSSESLVSAFEKLADQNLSDKDPAPWVEVMLHSHPSINRRIERARQLG